MYRFAVLGILAIQPVLLAIRHQTANVAAGRHRTDADHDRLSVINCVSKPKVGTPDFRIVYEFPGGPATNDMTNFHDVTSIGNRQGQIGILFNQ
jgi:hypothetical protein